MKIKRTRHMYIGSVMNKKYKKSKGVPRKV